MASKIRHLSANVTLVGSHRRLPSFALVLAFLSVPSAAPLSAPSNPRLSGSSSSVCWAHNGQSTNGQTVLTSGPPAYLAAGSRPARVFAFYAAPQFAGYNGHTCVVSLNAATGRVARVAEITHGVPLFASIPVDNRDGLLALALENSSPNTRVVTVSQATLKVTQHMQLPGRTGSEIMAADANRLFVSTVTGCPKGCKWRTYILAVNPLRIVGSLGFGPIEALDSSRGRLFAMYRSHGLAAVGTASGKVQWVTPARGLDSCRVLPVGSTSADGPGQPWSSIFPVTGTGDVWIYGFTRSTEEYQPGTADFCLVAGGSGRVVRTVHVSQADGACITLMDNPAKVFLVSIAQADCSSGSEALSAATGDTIFDGKQAESPMANGPDGTIYFNPIALGKVSKMSPPKWAPTAAANPGSYVSTILVPGRRVFIASIISGGPNQRGGIDSGCWSPGCEGGSSQRTARDS